MNREKLKTISFFLLIILSVVQLGILWGFDVHKLPFNFLQAFKDTPPSTSESVLKEELYKPNKLVISAGENESHWIITKGSDFSDDYLKVWNDTKSYIRKIASNAEIQSSGYIDQKWEDIILKRSIYVEFGTYLSGDLITYFDENKAKSSDFNGLKKIVFDPWDDRLNFKTMVVYTLDKANKVQKYSINISKDNLTRDYYDEFITRLSKAEASEKLRSYSILNEARFNVKLPYTIRPDMFVVSYGSKYESLNTINATPSKAINIDKDTTLSEIEDNISYMLGTEKDSYNISVDTSETIIMQNKNNIFRIYNKGILEYNRINVSMAEKGTEAASIKRAFEFINAIGLRPDKNVELYLSEVKEERDRYKFTFDYKVDGLPLYVEMGSYGKSKYRVNNAIVIEANSSEVISCWGILRDFEISKEKKLAYNVNFIDLMDKIFKEFPNMKNEKGLAVENTLCGYVISDNTAAQKLEPHWFVKTASSEYYYSKLPIRKD